MSLSNIKTIQYDASSVISNADSYIKGILNLGQRYGEQGQGYEIIKVSTEEIVDTIFSTNKQSYDKDYSYIELCTNDEGVLLKTDKGDSVVVSEYTNDNKVLVSDDLVTVLECEYSNGNKGDFVVYADYYEFSDSVNGTKIENNIFYHSNQSYPLSFNTTDNILYSFVDNVSSSLQTLLNSINTCYSNLVMNELENFNLNYNEYRYEDFLVRIFHSLEDISWTFGDFTRRDIHSSLFINSEYEFLVAQQTDGTTDVSPILFSPNLIHVAVCKNSTKLESNLNDYGILYDYAYSSQSMGETVRIVNLCVGNKCTIIGEYTIYQLLAQINSIEPFIGSNGNWFVNNEDTLVSAQGIDAGQPNLVIVKSSKTLEGTIEYNIVGSGSQDVENKFSLMDVKEVELELHNPFSTDDYASDLFVFLLPQFNTLVNYSENVITYIKNMLIMNISDVIKTDDGYEKSSYVNVTFWNYKNDTDGFVSLNLEENTTMTLFNLICADLMMKGIDEQVKGGLKLENLIDGITRPNNDSNFRFEYLPLSKVDVSYKNSETLSISPIFGLSDTSVPTVDFSFSNSGSVSYLSCLGSQLSELYLVMGNAINDENIKKYLPMLNLGSVLTKDINILNRLNFVVFTEGVPYNVYMGKDSTKEGEANSFVIGSDTSNDTLSKDLADELFRTKQKQFENFKSNFVNNIFNKITTKSIDTDEIKTKKITAEGEGESTFLHKMYVSTRERLSVLKSQTIAKFDALIDRLYVGALETPTIIGQLGVLSVSGSLQPSNIRMLPNTQINFGDRYWVNSNGKASLSDVVSSTAVFGNMMVNESANFTEVTSKVLLVKDKVTSEESEIKFTTNGWEHCTLQDNAYMKVVQPFGRVFDLNNQNFTSQLDLSNTMYFKYKNDIYLNVGRLIKLYGISYFNKVDVISNDVYYIKSADFSKLSDAKYSVDDLYIRQFIDAQLSAQSLMSYGINEYPLIKLYSPTSVNAMYDGKISSSVCLFFYQSNGANYFRVNELVSHEEYTQVVDDLNQRIYDLEHRIETYYVMFIDKNNEQHSTSFSREALKEGKYTFNLPRYNVEGYNQTGYTLGNGSDVYGDSNFKFYDNKNKYKNITVTLLYNDEEFVKKVGNNPNITYVVTITSDNIYNILMKSSTAQVEFTGIYEVSMNINVYYTKIDDTNVIKLSQNVSSSNKNAYTVFEPDTYDFELTDGRWYLDTEKTVYVSQGDTIDLNKYEEYIKSESTNTKKLYLYGEIVDAYNVSVIYELKMEDGTSINLDNIEESIQNITDKDTQSVGYTDKIERYGTWNRELSFYNVKDSDSYEICGAKVMILDNSKNEYTEKISYSNIIQSSYNLSLSNIEENQTVKVVLTYRKVSGVTITLNMLEISGTYNCTYDNLYIGLKNNSKVKIKDYIDSFKLLDSDGTVYTFVENGTATSSDYKFVKGSNINITITFDYTKFNKENEGFRIKSTDKCFNYTSIILEGNLNIVYQNYAEIPLTVYVEFKNNVGENLPSHSITMSKTQKTDSDIICADYDLTLVKVDVILEDSISVLGRYNYYCTFSNSASAVVDLNNKADVLLDFGLDGHAVATFNYSPFTKYMGLSCMVIIKRV